ncbi:MAG: alanine dehydrogenase [bacterium]
MIIGIPKEFTSEERRIALTPVGVYALTRKGHTVYIESQAGEVSGFHNRDFKQVGAEILYSHEEVFRRSEIIVKVQAPIESESQFLERSQVVMSFLNLGLAQKPTLLNFQENRITAIGYELIRNQENKRPILRAMSQIAGNLLPQIAGRLLESQSGGRGILLASVAGIPPATVVILGAGVVGFHAARAFSQLGANVLVLDKDVDRLGKIDLQFNKRVITSIVTPYNIERFTKIADVLIGAISVHGERTPHIVSEQLVAEMKKGSVIIDVSIDEGGCIETCRPTSLSEPTYRKHDVTHYCVPNITASVARTASYALNNVLTPLILEIAEKGIANVMAQNKNIEDGVYLYQGNYKNPAVANYFMNGG